jgi:hypothetical protein
MDAPDCSAHQPTDLFDLAMRELRCTLERSEEVANKNAVAIEKNSEQIAQMAEALQNVALRASRRGSDPRRDLKAKSAPMEVDDGHDASGESDGESFNDVFASSDSHKGRSKVSKIPKQRDPIRNAFYVSSRDDYI